MDRILCSAWRMAIVVMICGAGGVALFVGYRGMFELLAGRVASAGVCAGIGATGAWAAALLCRHRSDLL
jgi:hypothetical protein